MDPDDHLHPDHASSQIRIVAPPVAKFSIIGHYSPPGR
jgi:hypothetical protein